MIFFSALLHPEFQHLISVSQESPIRYTPHFPMLGRLGLLPVSVCSTSKTNLLLFVGMPWNSSISLHFFGFPRLSPDVFESYISTVMPASSSFFSVLILVYFVTKFQDVSTLFTNKHNKLAPIFCSKLISNVGILQLKFDPCMHACMDVVLSVHFQLDLYNGHLQADVGHRKCSVCLGLFVLDLNPHK